MPKVGIWQCVITALIVALGAPLLHYLWFLLRRIFQRDLPPGPLGLPLLGYLPFMTKDGHRDIEALRQKYGNVFGLHLGFRYVVFLCDFGSIKEALSNDVLLNRAQEFPLNVHEKSQSMILANGPRWREQRRFTMRTFRTLISTTQALETHIHDELSNLVRELASRKGEPVAIMSLLTSSTSNVITALMYGRRYEYGSPERVELDELAEGIPSLAAQMSAINFFPWLRRVLSMLRIGPCGRLRSAMLQRDRFSETLIGLHEKTYQDGLVRDYIDGFLGEMRRPEQEKKTFTRDVLRSNASSFFGAGSETVRSAIEWLLVMCAAKPEMQKRIRAEIDVVLGQSGQGSRVLWEDRGRMPYTQAFIWEMMRCEPINPFGLMRSANEDTKISGYCHSARQRRGAFAYVHFLRRLLLGGPGSFPTRALLGRRRDPSQQTGEADRLLIRQAFVSRGVDRQHGDVHLSYIYPAALHRRGAF
ncbi:cytochrome P450 2J2-like isoform X2 [Dermacentor silvarum]|uniref:cytochrome P450 2J2-like isoform X2 n=1 Tax=Dermacentor silvarum TaxID=543639 RepID=UPI0021009269|nr:cytochrome P450 2J2-like isoform X2 [Dermacentor silvarum]